MTDWLPAIKKQAEFAARMRERVKKALDRADLTFNEASRVQQSVGKSACAFRRMQQCMADRGDVNDRLLYAADCIERSWSLMALDTENRLRFMVGQRPISANRLAGDI